VSPRRFHPVDGRPLGPVEAFRLEERVVETLTRGDADTWVVVPAWQEARLIGLTLDALAAQTGRPVVLCVVDNGSTDGTVEVIRAWAAAHTDKALRLVHEPDKGTGAAADTGMRVGAAAGARFLLRTDADTLPALDWADRLRGRLDDDLELVSGRVIARLDQEPMARWQLALTGALMVAAGVVCRVTNRGEGYLTRFHLCIGTNLGIRADTYLRAGGFPRSRIDEVHEDRALMNRVRRLTTRVGREPRAVVATSARRYHAYGLVGVVRWYLANDPGRSIVDVR
jgi:glycosyltransferase involved in cell wall biosynthesis